MFDIGDSAISSDTHSAVTPPARTVDVLDRGECFELLRRSHFGRLAVSATNRPPVIRPVHYMFDDPSQSIVIKTARGSKLGALLASRGAAFEIDSVDHENVGGWSVIITGVAEEITSRSERERIEAAGLQSWAPGDRHTLVRIRAFTVTGRRITLS